MLIATLVFPPIAHAEWSAGIGPENYNWTEYPAGSALHPKESGLRSAVFVNWTQDRDTGFLFAWRAKIYSGRVKYDTAYIATGTPVSTHTKYSGAASELQLRYRIDAGALNVDYLAGMGADTWSRTVENIGFNQVEDYSILFMRAGVDLGPPEREAGFHGGFGLKYPVATNEDAHLDQLGAYNNPSLSPGSSVSAYAEFGYRINQLFDVVGYYDSWRFSQSDPVVVYTPAGGLCGPTGACLIYQPESHMNTVGLKLNVSPWWM